ncbi:MAG: Rossmann-like and DUF2520 domain-containing protein [Rikenellaceae bacterium]
MDVVIIGSGNIAYSLTFALKNSSSTNLLQICSRGSHRGLELASRVEVEHISSYEKLKKAHLYIVCVSDSVQCEVQKKVAEFVDSNAIIAHTSGAIAVENGDNFARFYPLQTFTYGVEADFKKITIFVEANSLENEKKLITLANIIAKGGEKIDADTLKVVHLAATFANNFTNRMFHYAETILQRVDIDRSVLYPLMEESVAKIERTDKAVRLLQSGAAARGDISTINSHLELIANMGKGEDSKGDNGSEMEEIYQIITKAIYNDKF